MSLTRKMAFFVILISLITETNPIQTDNKLIGFQAKYYADSVPVSGKEKDLTEAVEGGCKILSWNYDIIFLYKQRAFSKFKKRYGRTILLKINVENIAQNLNIEIEWRGLSNIEAQHMQDSFF